MQIQIDLKRDNGITRIAIQGKPEGSEQAELQAKMVILALYEVDQALKKTRGLFHR